MTDLTKNIPLADNKADKTVALEKRIAELEKEAAENLAGWQRARADYQNLKKEFERKEMQFMSDAKEIFLEEFLPIYDHLKRALAEPIDASHVKEWRAGMEQIEAQWLAVLKKLGVEAVPTLNEKFNPDIHLAIEHRGSGDMVIEEMQGGYRVNGRLLYPAKVVVGDLSTPNSD